MRISIAIFVLLLSIGASAQTVEEILLYPRVEGPPAEKVRITEAGEHVISSIHNPSITPFLPKGDRPTAAVIISPGGGHRELWIDHEGYLVAKWFQERGVAAFVLKYRLANEEGSKYTVDDHAVVDMVTAVQLVRSRAAEWNINPDRIGILGFSAGGEVTALTDRAGTDGDPEAKESVKKFSSKPNFHVLIYPGRSHRIEPTRDSSPVFIVCGYKDREDISEGMATTYLKYRKQQVSAELHIYADAGHGFGLRTSNSGPSSHWIERLWEWMEGIGVQN